MPCYTSSLYPGINDINETDNLISLSKEKSIQEYQNIDFSLLGAILSLNICNLILFIIEIIKIFKITKYGLFLLYK